MSQQALTPLQQYMKTSQELMSAKPITNQQLEERINQLVVDLHQYRMAWPMASTPSVSQ